MTAQHTLIIAEAGVNHNGSIDMALQLVDAAAKAGADFVKFQTFSANRLAAASAPKAEYQKQTTANTETQLDMLRRLELSAADHQTLIDRCREKGIRFLSSPFDLESLAFLADDLKLEVIKLPSGEITNPLLLLKAGQSQRKLILSTGMATLDEIKFALGVLAFGFLASSAAPSRAAFEQAYNCAEGQALLRERVTLLHCTTEYPAPLDDIHLRAMATMRTAFGLQVGYSDHTPGIAVSIGAVALGATVIEKHLTLDRTLPGPDHRASLELKEFGDMCAGIREIETALGDSEKICRPSELKNRSIARKSLVAARKIASGETLTADNVTMKRPATGRSAAEYWDVLGQAAKRAYEKDEPL